VIGFTTEFKAARSIEALRALGTRSARVRRDGHTRFIPAEALVPGDIVVLEAGDAVSADLRLVEASNLAADESTLTGESVAVEKATQPVAAGARLNQGKRNLSQTCRSNVEMPACFAEKGDGLSADRVG
jgi:P-type Ca2+ transporter type 2C